MPDLQADHGINQLLQEKSGAAQRLDAADRVDY